MKTMKKRVSLFAVLVLALSFALSPVSAFAEELDTPVHEDPIDEEQTVTTEINRHFSLNTNGVAVVFDVSAECECIWTEGISGQFGEVTIDLTNISVAGNASYVKNYLGPRITSYGIGGRAMEYFWLDYTSAYEITVLIDIFCDEYGDLTLNAYAYKTIIV